MKRCWEGSRGRGKGGRDRGGRVIGVAVGDDDEAEVVFTEEGKEVGRFGLGPVFVWKEGEEGPSKSLSDTSRKERKGKRQGEGK
jgi:hypothetical protein